MGSSPLNLTAAAVCLRLPEVAHMAACYSMWAFRFHCAREGYIPDFFTTAVADEVWRLVNQ